MSGAADFGLASGKKQREHLETLRQQTRLGARSFCRHATHLPPWSGYRTRATRPGLRPHLHGRACAAKAEARDQPPIFANVSLQNIDEPDPQA